MTERVGIINYGMGNLKSVLNALEFIGKEGCFVEKAEDFNACSRLIIPGVGAYSEAMKNIRFKGLEAAIRAHVGKGKPLLGICLGMQLLSDEGDEIIVTKGLGLIRGRVEKLNVSLHVPHVGWNNITQTRPHPLFNGVRKEIDYYFVHSYYFNAARSADVLATVDYERNIPCVVTDGGCVIGVQFHPEKSQKNGLKILENFCDWDGKTVC